MALAILELTDLDETGYALQLDTGTNTHFEIRVGDAVVRRAGSSFVDKVFQQTPFAPSESEGDPLAPPQELHLQTPARPGRHVYAQMYSYKSGRRSPAFSDVVELPPIGRPRPRHSSSQSVGIVNVVADQTAIVRPIAHRSLAEANSISFDQILAELLKIAQPVVASVLKSEPGHGVTASSGADVVATLLKAVLGAVSGQAASLPVSPVSQAKSLDFGNRFNGGLSEPFIFGIDDALIAAVIGPLVQVLPQLMNAANQKDKDRRAADQAFQSGILKDINQRLLMDKVLEAQRHAMLAAGSASNGQAPAINPDDLATLAALIGKAQAATVGQPAKSLSLRPSRKAAQYAAPASRAALEPLSEAPLEWSGGRDPLYSRNHRLALRYRFNVAAPAPSKPLSRATFTVTLVDDSNPKIRFEKSLKLTAVAANSELECVIEPGEIAHLLTGSRLAATASLRWRGKNGPVEALGSSRLVLVGPVFVKARANEVGGERELTDMRRWRAFWNKVWEAPTLDRAENSKRRWRLDADLRYTVLIGADARNGIMETRRRETEGREDPDYALTIGRLKAGLEIGLAPLLQLRPLWDLGELPPDALDALSNREFRAACGGEMQRRIELKGRAGERGLVWAIPTFRLFDVILGRVAETNAAGAVTRTSDETIQVPLPVGVRLLGLKSK